MKLPLENIQAAAQQVEAAMIDFTRRMIQTPSLPGQENEVAAIISQKMAELAYDEVWTDEVGNVIGRIKGGEGPVVLLNGHMDHVDPGPVEGWPYPPFSGQVVGDELWGRASVDMKGPVACMVYAASLFKRLGLRPPGDILMTVPVMEEVCGLGTQHLAAQHKAQAAIVGEPSNNGLRRGHRGRVELQVQFTGRSAHASVPHLGLNPHYLAAAFLTRLPQVALAHDKTLGSSTVVPTLYTTDQSSPNVIPSQVYLTLDWRNVPGESPEAIVAEVQAILDECLEPEPGFQATVTIPSSQLTTYTGISHLFPSVFPSFIMPEDHPLVQAAHKALNETLGREVDVDVWRFATDGGHLMAAGIPTIGFGPGDDKLAHTNQERISLAQMREAVVGYAALTLALAEAADKT